jgi:poly(3-hydroxybutyrate) depolymerase
MRCTWLLPLALSACSSSPVLPDQGVARDGLLPVMPDLRATPDAPAPADRPSPDRRRWREAGALAKVTCGVTPAGATLAPPLPSYAGTCPKLAAGSNSIVSSGATRQFLLVLPGNPQPAERFPVLFMWHWLKGSASSFLTQGDVQASADQQRLIAVIPQSKNDINLFGVIPLPWPFTLMDSEARMQEEYTFFDDMLACVGQQFPVDKECVSSAGVSAGALFTLQLAAARADRLASFISLSGGVPSGGNLVNDKILRPWTPPTSHRPPGLVLWGGPTDHCVMIDFQAGSQDLETQLVDNNEFFVECVHNCGHAEPPITALPGQSRYQVLWDFALRHPYWLDAGDSPYLDTGYSFSNVPWCAIGKGSATPRTGSCPPPACPF